MAYTSTSVHERVRRQLEDIGPSYKWRDSEIYLYISDGRDEVARRRPDALTGTSVAVSDLTAITTSGQSLEVDDMFIAPIVDYACYRAHMKRAPFCDPNKGQLHYKAFLDAIAN